MGWLSRSSKKSANVDCARSSSSFSFDASCSPRAGSGSGLAFLLSSTYRSVKFGGIARSMPPSPWRVSEGGRRLGVRLTPLRLAGLAAARILPDLGRHFQRQPQVPLVVGLRHVSLGVTERDL